MEAIKKSEFPCNCSTVVVGKNVSATGCVILGHNEDDYDAVSQAYRVPRKKHQPGETSASATGTR